jgi:hypothetical protein
MVLFSLLAAGDLPKGQVLELTKRTKRTQMPCYEVARNLLQGAISSDLVASFLV